jgi:hypothetical protein
MMEKVLLHACCGICSGYPIEKLRELGYEVEVYFCNDNFDTREEFERRLEAERKLCEYLGAKLIIASYQPEVYYNYVKGLESEPERGKRCIKCFELRIRQTGEKAKELGIENITTSMIISPHKDFKTLSEVGERVCGEIGVKFLGIDFKKQDGFLKTNRISKELGLYRQNYCGCRFARERKK